MTTNVLDINPDHPNEPRSDAVHLLAAATELKTAMTTPVVVNPDETPFYLATVPKGYESKLIDLRPQQTAPQPVQRAKGVVHVVDTDSLRTYLDRHADDGTVLYVRPNGSGITAVLNDHVSPAEPRWQDWRVDLTWQATDAWAKWSAVDGKMLDQVAFAELIEDSIKEIARPDAATLLEVAQTFAASTNVTFRSSIRLATGQTQLAWVEEQDGRAGKDGLLEVPDRIVLVLAPFEGAAPRAIEARFRYRVASGAVKMGVILERPRDFIKAAVLDELEKVVDVPGLMVAGSI